MLLSYVWAEIGALNTPSTVVFPMTGSSVISLGSAARSYTRLDEGQR